MGKCQAVALGPMRHERQSYFSVIQRRCEIKGGTLIDGGVEANLSPMLLNDQFRDRQPQTVAAHLRLQVVIRLVKAFKNMAAVFRRNAIAGIYYRDHHKMLIVWTSAKCNRAAGRSKFDGVGDQVVKHLLHALWINIEQG